MNVLEIIGRDQELFGTDIEDFSEEVNDNVAKSKFLVVGGAGSIGQAVTREIFKPSSQSPYITIYICVLCM